MGLAVLLATVTPSGGRTKGQRQLGAHALPWGSELTEAFALKLVCPCRRWRHRVPNLPALSPSQGAAVRGKLELSAASAIPAEPRFRWETVSVNLSTDLAPLLCPN